MCVYARVCIPSCMLHVIFWRICNHGNRDAHLQCMVEVTICGMLDTNGSNSSTSVGDGIRSKPWAPSNTSHCCGNKRWLDILGGRGGIFKLTGLVGRGDKWMEEEKEGERREGDTCTWTMIPFELYSLRRISEKWLSNLCRMKDNKLQLLFLTTKIKIFEPPNVWCGEICSGHFKISQIGYFNEN